MSLLDRVQRKAEGDAARTSQDSSESAAPTDTGPPAAPDEGSADTPAILRSADAGTPVPAAPTGDGWGPWSTARAGSSSGTGGGTGGWTAQITR
jgi:hypothetical protein